LSSFVFLDEGIFLVGWEGVEHPYHIVKDVFWGEWFLHLRQIIIEVHAVGYIDPGGPTVSGEVSFLSALEAGSLASRRGVVGLGDVSIHSLTPLSSLAASPLVIPSVGQGPCAC